jgi:hypothetical protein
VLPLPPPFEGCSVLWRPTHTMAADADAAELKKMLRGRVRRKKRATTI